MVFSFQLSQRFLVSLALLTSSVVAVVPAHAEGASETARVTELFKNGKLAFGKGDMVEAEAFFAQAWAIRKSSDIAANLGQAQLEQQKFRSAAEHFSWALSNLLPSATDAQRRAVESGLARARAEVGVLRLEVQPEGADVLVGEHAVGKAPIGSGVFVDAGEVIVSAKLAGHVSVEKRVQVGKGTEQAVTIQLSRDDATSAPSAAAVGAGAQAQPASSEPFAPADDRGARKSLVPAYIATGVAVAGGVTGLVLTLSASSKEDDADALRDRLNADGGCGGTEPSSDCAELKSQRESVDSTRNIALGAFIVGGVAAVAAGYFYWDALAAKKGSASARQRPVPVLPRLELARGAPGSGAAFEAVKLTFSGNF